MILKYDRVLEVIRNFGYTIALFAILVAGFFTCSGRKPRPTNRAGNRRKYGQRLSSFKGAGSVSGFEFASTRRITRFCIATCNLCVAHVGKILRFSTARKSSSVGVPLKSFTPRMFAVATAS
jgi:hypothetical protein